MRPNRSLLRRTRHGVIQIKTSSAAMDETSLLPLDSLRLTGVLRMTDFTSLSTSELANRIAILRDNLRQLTEQAAAQSGAANEERLADRIETQSKELEGLLKEQERRG